MTGDELQHLLEEIPSLPERQRVREFLSMTPEHQRVHTYREAHATKEELAQLRQCMEGRFDALMIEIADLKKPLWKQALAPVTVAGAFVAGFMGPDFPKWGP